MATMLVRKSWIYVKCSGIWIRIQQCEMIKTCEIEVNVFNFILEVVYVDLRIGYTLTGY